MNAEIQDQVPTIENLKNEIEELNKSLTGNMMEDMDTRDKIHNIQMRIDGVKPTDSYIECIGCGS